MKCDDDNKQQITVHVIISTALLIQYVLLYTYDVAVVIVVFSHDVWTIDLQNLVQAKGVIGQTSVVKNECFVVQRKYNFSVFVIKFLF